MALGITDIIFLVISLLASLGIGIYHSIKGRKATPTEYMLGGRAIKPLPLAMSLMVGTISAITIMGNAGEMYVHGTQLWMMDFGMVLGMIMVAEIFIPVFYPLKMISLYQYIEDRFGSVWLRRATVVVQLSAAYLYMGFLLFPPSIFLELSTGLPKMANIIIIGFSCTLYSAFGGVKAVIYTDGFQLWVMIGGVLAIIIQGSLNVGGIGEVWDICYHRGRIEFLNFSFDPYQRHSFWLTIIYGFFFNLNVFGVTQNQTQRTFSTGSVEDAKRVMYYAAFGLVFLRGIIQFSGLVIFANFADCDPLTANGIKRNSALAVVKYVTSNLTHIPGLAGLFVASIYAAVLSSVSTQVNSLTALLWEDFLKTQKMFANWNDQKITRFQKCLVILAGVIGILMSVVASSFTSFLDGLFKLTGAISGPMVGLFLVALLLPWVKIQGAALGLLCSVAISMWILIGQLKLPQPDYLPMSHEDCLDLAPPVLNITETLNNTIEGDLLKHESVHSIYGLSYCLNFCWGTIVCVVVSLIVTAFTGCNTPQTVEEKLIYGQVWKLFAYRSAPVSQSPEGSDKTFLRKLFNKKDSLPPPTPLPPYEDDVATPVKISKPNDIEDTSPV